MRNMYLKLLLALMLLLSGCSSNEGRNKDNNEGRNENIRKDNKALVSLQEDGALSVEMSAKQFKENLLSQKSFSLTNDLTLEEWESVPEHRGKLEGNGKKITIKSFKSDARGLIKEIGEGGQIKEIKIELKSDFIIKVRSKDPYKDAPGGVLAAFNKGKVEGIKVLGEGQVKGDTVGGLVGKNEGTIKRSNAKVDVVGNTYVGGLVGINFKVIEKSYATGDATSNKSDSSVGGLVGYNQLQVKKSYATGRVTGVAKVGGLVGFNYGDNSVIERSYATGAVKGSVSVGGLVGYNEDASIKKSYAKGEVEGGEFAGGLVGEHRETHVYAVIENSYATGAVNGSKAGGLVGIRGRTGSIKNSFTKKGIQVVGKGSTSDVTAIATKDIRATTFKDKGWSKSVWKPFKAGQWPKLLWQPL